jgi:hypothetical protein
MVMIMQNPLLVLIQRATTQLTITIMVMIMQNPLLVLIQRATTQLIITITVTLMQQLPKKGLVLRHLCINNVVLSIQLDYLFS